MTQMTKANDVTRSTEIFVPTYLSFQEVLDKHERAHWNTDEADMRVDVEQWKNGKITESEKSFIKMILRLFTQADTNVAAGYVERLLPVFRSSDARMMLLSFAAREVTHIKAYKKLNDTLGYDSAAFSSEFLAFTEMREKHEFMIDAAPMETPTQIAIYLAKQALMEGVGLFAPFSMLLSYAGEGKLPGMININKWSIRDESFHVVGLMDLLRVYLSENPEIVGNEFKTAVYETYTEIIRLEDNSIDLAYSAGTNNNATAEQAKNYVRYIGDYRMQQMGFKSQYNIQECPIPIVEQVTGNLLGNFFETTIVEYSKNSLIGEWVY